MHFLPNTDVTFNIVQFRLRLIGLFSSIIGINHHHIMGGGKYLINSNQFSGGRIEAIMGGGTYDFMQAKPAPGINILDFSLVMGGVELILPAHWNIKIEVEPELSISQKLMLNDEKINYIDFFVRSEDSYSRF